MDVSEDTSSVLALPYLLANQISAYKYYQPISWGLTTTTTNQPTAYKTTNQPAGCIQQDITKLTADSTTDMRY